MGKELFVILGDSNTGKTTTIRALTGSYKKGKCLIETNNNNVDIYVLMGALQEARLDPHQAVKDLLIHDRLLIPLHFSGTRKYPEASEYIQTFINAGFTVSQLVALGSNKGILGKIQGTLPKILNVNTFRDMPNNHAAWQIRKAWGWK